MTNLQPFEIALILGIVLLLLEMVTGIFVFLSLSVGFFFVAGSELFFQSFSFGRDVLIFTIVAVAAFVAFRLIFRAKGDTTSADGDINNY